jgi:hypothetical protein
MKHILICLGIIVSLFGYGHAAQTPDQAKRSDEVVKKMRQIDLLTQVIPLALTKAQIEKLLPAIERARQKVANIQKDEAGALEKMDLKISNAIKKSVESGVAPPKELLTELADATQRMSLNRLVAIDDNTDAVIKVLNDTLNAGQKKAAANSLSTKLIDPNAKPDTITDAQKLRFFVQEILLDPQCYDILVQLEKYAS